LDLDFLQKLTYWTATQGQWILIGFFFWYWIWIDIAINQLLTQNYKGRGRRSSAELTDFFA